MKRTLALTFAAAMLCAPGRSQAPAIVSGPPTNELQVKDTPASQSLNDLAKSKVNDDKAVNDLFQQARSMLDQNQKTLQTALQDAIKDLNDKMAADKKYKDLMAHIKDLQKQIQDAQAKAQTEFQQKVGGVQSKAATENAQVQALIPIVRKESGLPDNATFDVATQKWTVPAVPEKK